MLIFNAISSRFALAGLSIAGHIHYFHLAAPHSPTRSLVQPHTLAWLHPDPSW